MVIIFIDKKKYHVNSSDNLLHVCLSLGFDIPYFCWHPILGSVGACRQCMVKKYCNSDDKIGQLVISCMTPIVNELRISINDSESIEFRKGIIELLMINHPHDCPVCEEGGNCHLQDMTVLTGHNMRRYRFLKRTHKNQYLGPFIEHEMNRCISCYRCVRYYKDYADGTDFGVYGISNNVYFGRLEDGSLESEFSGNLIDICPTGVFTDKIQSKKYSRKWDLQYAPSICQHCCVGCNISVGEKHGEICKIENRYHKNINNYFLCDLGRFGYGYSNLKDRPKYSVYRNEHEKKIFKSTNHSITSVVELLSLFPKTIGIGSNRASLESNYALQTLVGNKNFSMGMLQQESNCVVLIKDILENGGIYTPTLREIENCDVILVLGEDITQTSPMVALSIRQAMKRTPEFVTSSKNISEWHSLAIKNTRQDVKNTLFITHTYNTKLDDISEEQYFSSINNQVKLGFEIAHQIDKSAPSIKNLSQSAVIKIKKIVSALLLSKNPLIVSGSHSNSIELIQAAYNIAKSLKNLKKNIGLVLLTSNSNSLGVSLLKGISLEEVIKRVLKKEYNSLIILENDIYRYFPQYQISKLFSAVKNIIVIDHLNTNTMKEGTISLPSTNFFESSGTVINYECRAQRFFQVHDPRFYCDKIHILDSWMWLHLIECKLRKKRQTWYKLDDIIYSMSSTNCNFKQLMYIAPDASFRVFGQKFARSPHRLSGRAAIRSNINVHEISQPKDKNSMFSFSMEGCQQFYKYSSYIPFSWIPGWNSIQSLNKFKKKNNRECHFGNSGKHLLSYDSSKFMSWFDPTDFSINHDENNYDVFPLYTLFGSEQLSQFSPDISQNISDISAIMNENDARILSIQSGSIVEFKCFGIRFTAKIIVSSMVKSKQLGLFLGYFNLPFVLSRKKVIDFRKITV
ncbi:MAG: NADH-quinone oxidoreductase subunit NuoG [Buchnera aphidicola (Schlechtendalia peitan)]